MSSLTYTYIKGNTLRIQCGLCGDVYSTPEGNYHLQFKQLCPRCSAKTMECYRCQLCFEDHFRFKNETWVKTCIWCVYEASNVFSVLTEKECNRCEDVFYSDSKNETTCRKCVKELELITKSGKEESKCIDCEERFTRKTSEPWINKCNDCVTEEDIDKFNKLKTETPSSASASGLVRSHGEEAPTGEKAPQRGASTKWDKHHCDLCQAGFWRKSSEKWRNICVECFKASLVNKEKVTCQICEDDFTRLKTETWRNKCSVCYKASQASKISVYCNKCRNPFKIELEQKDWRKTCGKCYYNK